MAKGRIENSQLAPQFHNVRYLDAQALSKCWLPFMGEGALFVPAHPVRPWLKHELPTQVLLILLPDLRQYCLFARIAMILPAGTGPDGRGGYLMLLDKSTDVFRAAMANTATRRKAKGNFDNLAEWLHDCADNDS